MPTFIELCMVDRASLTQGILALALGIVVSGCAALREFEVSGNGARLSATQDRFYVVVNASSEVVDYNYLAFPLDYDSYAAWRVPIGTKLQVPVEIVKYLEAQGKRTTMGPADQVPEADTAVIRYEELWGWDMGSILKKLKIELSRAGSSDKASVAFEEMTIFNTHPTASSLVPAMMVRLLEAK